MKKPAYSLEGLLQKSFKKTTAALSGRAVVQYLLSKPTKYFIKDIHLFWLQKAVTISKKQFTLDVTIFVFSCRFLNIITKTQNIIKKLKNSLVGASNIFATSLFVCILNFLFILM